MGKFKFCKTDPPTLQSDFFKLVDPLTHPIDLWTREVKFGTQKVNLPKIFDIVVKYDIKTVIYKSLGPPIVGPFVPNKTLFLVLP